MDLEKFEQFRRKFDPSFAKQTGGSGSSGNSIKWPSSGSGGQSRQQANDDDDLYSWLIIAKLIIKLIYL